MDKKLLALIIVVIIAICSVSAFFLSQSPNIDNGNTTNKTNSTVNTTNNKTIPSENTTNKGITDKNGVTASLNGPKFSEKGKTVSITWKIINNGNESITNVNAVDQSNSNKFGNIGPGESKTFTFNLPIPNSGVSNPFFIGGFSVNYDLNGETFDFNANTLEIQLV